MELHCAVDQTKVMLGTFGPQREPYVQVMNEETTPSGMLARGSYTARTKVCLSACLLSYLAALLITVAHLWCTHHLISCDELMCMQDSEAALLGAWQLLV